MSGVGIDLARFVESKLLQNTARGDIPSADSCPHPLVACLGCPSDHGSTRLGCIAEPVSPTQQLVGQFGLVGRAVPMEDQPAISDDIPALFRSTAKTPGRGSSGSLRISEAMSSTVGRPSASIRRCAGTLASRSIHSRRSVSYTHLTLPTNREV